MGGRQKKSPRYHQPKPTLPDPTDPRLNDTPAVMLATSVRQSLRAGWQGVRCFAPLSQQQLATFSSSLANLAAGKEPSVNQGSSKCMNGTCNHAACNPGMPFSARGYATVVDGLKYAESHEWVKLEGGEATIGITDFAQAELGDVVYVELPEVGSSVEAKETFGVVESVKAASDVYSPVTGEVTAVNDALVDDPSKLNSKPFEGGWMMKIKVSDASEADGLMDSAAYSAQCEE